MAMTITTLWVIFLVLFFISLLISLYRYFKYRRNLSTPTQPHHVVATPVYAVYSNGAFVGTTEGNHGEFSAAYQNHEGQPYPYPPQGPPPSYFHYENHTQVVTLSGPGQHSSPPPPPYNTVQSQSQQAQPVVVGFNSNCNAGDNTNNNNDNVNNLNNGQHQPHNQQLQAVVPKTVTAPFTEIPLNN